MVTPNADSRAILRAGRKWLAAKEVPSVGGSIRMVRLLVEALEKELGASPNGSSGSDA